MNTYTQILQEELIPAMGCTEPIAIALAAAFAARTLDDEILRIDIRCSGNIIKNVKGVTVPNSGGLKGIEAAAALGAIGGAPDRGLEVLEGVTDEDREKAARFLVASVCDVSLAENVPNLFIEVTMTGPEHTSAVVIENIHNHIARLERDGVLLHTSMLTDTGAEVEQTADRKGMSLEGILQYTETVPLDEIREILSRQISFNEAIAQEGMSGNWGSAVGKTLCETWGDSVQTRASAFAAAGSDARMSGCPMPVVINSGSGNQGITVTMPVLTYAREWKVGEEKTLRALALSNLVSIYIKHYIGALSAFCGAVSASCGAGSAITYLAGGDRQQISHTIVNTLVNVGGIVCDGAKPSCAAKIASSVNAALLGHYMSMKGRYFLPGEGLVEEDIEETIKNMGYIGKVGMRPTDTEILNVMIDKVDVDSYL